MEQTRLHDPDLRRQVITRNYNIDCLRFILIVFVVQHHMNPYNGVITPYAIFNVHLIVWMFMLVSLYLLKVRGASFRQVKWIRLILPYLSWSIIYLCLRSFKSFLQGNEVSFKDWTLEALLTGGTAVHLYFIPLLIIYQLIACALTGVFSKKAPKSTVILSCGILGVVFLISSFLELKSTVIGSDYGLFIDAIFAVICARILLALRADAGSVHSGLLKVVFLLAAVAALLLWQSDFNDSILVKVVIASGIFYLILRLPISDRLGRFNGLFTASFGIFLMHHVIIEFAEVLFPELGVQFLPYDLSERLLGTLVVVVISFGLVGLIRRSKYLSLLLIGEKKT